MAMSTVPSQPGLSLQSSLRSIAFPSSSPSTSPAFRCHATIAAPPTKKYTANRDHSCYQSFSNRFIANRSVPISIPCISKTHIPIPRQRRTRCELGDPGEEVVAEVQNVPTLLGNSDNSRVLNSKSGEDDLLEEEIAIRQGGDGDGRSGNCCGGGGGGGGGGGERGDGGDCNKGDDGENRFAPISVNGELFEKLLNQDQVLREIKARGVVLPPDMLEAAKTMGIGNLILFRYLNLQESNWYLKWAVQDFPFLRDHLLADPRFLTKVTAEIVVESVCVTFAEVQKRGEDFWREFELYAADLVVGIAVGIALVSISAPSVRFGHLDAKSGFVGWIDHAVYNLPSSIFESGRLGHRFTLADRIGTYVYKGIQYGIAGFVCGIAGQALANSIMSIKRKLRTSNESVPVPPLLQTAVLWGVFLAVSSNIRYQIVAGLEQAVEASSLAKKLPPLTLAFTIGIRLANNVYGGMQFVDWARWSGIQ